MGVVLSVRNLRTEFRMRTANVVAVDDVSFEISEGECVGLVGESGCGKTTIGLSIMRLLQNNGHVIGGSIENFGKDLASLSEEEMQKVRGNEIAFIPQDPMTSLNPTMNIGRQIAEGFIEHRGASDEEGRQRALEVLRLVEMPRPEERLSQFPHELSGGLRQRVIIAMALVCEPKLLIADEPTTALDVTIQAQILDLIDRLRRDLKMAVLLITHDMGVIAGRTDRVVVMYAGKKAESAQTFDLFSQMRHPYTQALLNAVPKIEDAHYRLLSIPGLPPDLSTELTGCRFAERCSYVTSRCREVDPPIEIAKDSQSHEFACFNPILGARVSTEARVVSNQVDLRQAPVLIELQNVVKLFSVRSNGLFRRRTGQVHAISDISLVIRQGETFGLVGESGCGKTTTGKVMVGLEKPTSGTLTFQGEDLSGLRGDKRRYARRNIQMMFQDPYSSLNPRQRVGSILEEPLEIQRDGSSKERHARVLELLNQVGLSPSALIRYPHEFSGGQRQRIGLARALALKPRLLVADEPVSALDVSIQAQILNLIKDLQSDLGLSLLMISHDLGVVRYMADTVGVMYLGKLVEVGPSDEIYRNPCHPYTRGLLDSVPKPFATEAPEDVEIKIQGELPSSVFPPSGCRFRTRCPRAQEICANEEPPFRPFGTDHTAACHFPLRTPVMVEISSQVAPPR
jgi:oligopeptide/dipeptide ABC transporter ATP-binding protein